MVVEFWRVVVVKAFPMIGVLTAWSDWRVRLSPREALDSPSESELFVVGFVLRSRHASSDGFDCLKNTNPPGLSAGDSPGYGECISRDQAVWAERALCIDVWVCSGVCLGQETSRLDGVIVLCGGERVRYRCGHCGPLCARSDRPSHVSQSSCDKEVAGLARSGSGIAVCGGRNRG